MFPNHSFAEEREKELMLKMRHPTKRGTKAGRKRPKAQVTAVAQETQRGSRIRTKGKLKMKPTIPPDVMRWDRSSASCTDAIFCDRSKIVPLPVLGPYRSHNGWYGRPFWS